MADYVKQVTVTGDLSKIGDKDDVLRAWAAQTAKEISEQKPEFALVHVQGLANSKDPNYTARVISGGIVDDAEIYKQFPASRAFFDTRVTGLGSLYLFRDPEQVQFFDRFSNQGYHDVRSAHQHVIGSAECDGFMQNTFNQHYAFTRDFYRDDGTRDIAQQRTGFLLARFRIHGKEMTFVNVCLHSVPFEDVNEIAEHTQITKAAQTREDQIKNLINELDAEGLRNDAILVAGAFNAQLHETKLLEYLAKTQRVSQVEKKDERGHVEAIEHVDRHGRFEMVGVQEQFRYNGEMAAVTFNGALMEESVFFQPSRHYEMVDEKKEEFMRTLCPAWADRVLYNDRMSQLFRYDSFCASGLYYGLVAEEAYVGQYKPVALHSTICLK